MMHLKLKTLFATVFAATTAQCAILQVPAALPKNAQYDFIIVGGGTAGCALAARLTENAETKVLLIEAGGSNAGILAAMVPFLGVTLTGTPVDWNYTSIAQPGINNRTIPVARGFVLGGSSTINLMTWNRASNVLWDKWASLTGDSGWSWSHVEKFYLQTSSLVAPADGHNTFGQIIPSAHGHGPVLTSLPGFVTELDSRVINASKLLGGEFAFNEDLNAGHMLGYGYMQSSIGKGMRSSSATAYLAPALTRPNLDVLLNTQATQIVKTATVHGKPDFRTVKLATSAAHHISYTLTASKELILSSGVIGTPQLLLLSGIGPQSELEAIGITPVLNLPSVGKNLTEQPLLANYFSVNSTRTFDDLFRNSTIFANTLNQWQTTKQGLFVDSPGNTQGYMRLPLNKAPFSHTRDPSSGPGSAHLETIFVDGFAPFGSQPLPATGHFMSVLTAVVTPLSRGSLTLASTDPFTKPIIDLGFFNNPFDLNAMVFALKQAFTFLQSKPWAGFVLSPFGPLANATTDELKAEYARQFTFTENHAAGTAMMSPVDSGYGVVNPDLTLKQATGLRIVDASIFPHSPECHPQAVVYTVAERAVSLIRSRYNL